MSTVEEKYKKVVDYHGFGFRYVEGLTDENEWIKGFSLYAFGKQKITFALADTEWVDAKGQPYKCKIDDKVLYIKKLAIGFL